MSADTVAEELADLVEAAVQHAANTSDRSQQQAQHMLGMSDLGHCHEYARRMIVQEPFSDPRDKTAAWFGTIGGAAYEEAIGTFKPEDGWVFQDEVVTTLPSGVAILGHPDMYNRHVVVDLKSKRGTKVVRKMGQTQQQRFQLHGYAKGLIDAGKVDEEGLVVANVFYDRSGKETRPYVVADEYDPGVVKEIDDWLEDVFYAVREGEESSRDMPRDWCEQWCEFYTNCRVFDTDVTGLIESPDALAAVATYLEGSGLIKEGKAMQEEAKAELESVTGSTRTHFVRWTNVGATEVPGFTRAGYQRLDIRALPKGKK